MPIRRYLPLRQQQIQLLYRRYPLLRCLLQRHVNNFPRFLHIPQRRPHHSQLLQIDDFVAEVVYVHVAEFGVVEGVDATLEVAHLAVVDAAPDVEQ